MYILLSLPSSPFSSWGLPRSPLLGFALREPPAHFTGQGVLSRCQLSIGEAITEYLMQVLEMLPSSSFYQ